MFVYIVLYKKYITSLNTTYNIQIDNNLNNKVEPDDIDET